MAILRRSIKRRRRILRRRRRVGVKRRRIGMRRRRSFKRRRLSIPRVLKVRDAMFVNMFDKAANNWHPFSVNVFPPLQAISLFKEYKMIGARIWFRLRHPPPVRYVYNAQNQLVSSSVDIHELYYYPSAKYDEPVRNPRTSMKAREVTSGWQSVFIKSWDVEKHLIWNANQEFAGADYTEQGASDSNYVYHKVHRRPVWRDIVLNATTAAGDPGPLSKASMRFVVGYFYKSEDGHLPGHEATIDNIELRLQFYFVFRSRKPLDSHQVDLTGQLNKDLNIALSMAETPETAPGGTVFTFDTGEAVEPNS